MGQTLTHGVYLPDEGERNCYSGLASNWQLLDGAVGTIAEHTTQIAGKANAVHTHTVSQITDFPAYGNAAGTICEGNDSRLSDARTPVAHTHTKSDVTDLFNSANTWTNTNTFQQNVMYERTNLYHQVPNPCYVLKDTGLEKGSIASAAHVAYPGVWHDKNGNVLGYVRFVAYDTGLQRIEFRLSNLIKNGALAPTGSVVNCTALLELQPSGEKSLIPEQNNDINLGTSTAKWKTLNGINPGALSLPSENPSSVNLDPTNWVTDGSNYNSYTPPSDGWLGILVNSADVSDLTGQYIFVGRTSNINFWPQGFSVPLISDYNPSYLSGCVFMPVVSGKIVGIRIKMGKTQTEGSTITARFYPCLGNV